MAMTPDTPDFSSADTGLAGRAPAWTEQQDELILSYLSHPPRPLRHVYPPESLPPPEAIDEITSQILSASSWSQSPSVTRARVLDIARKQVAEYQLGPKREPIVIGPPGAKKPIRPRLGQAAFGMSRQQHSMDSLYGDKEAGTLSEAQRLSSNLQCTASDGAAKDLPSVNDLASPLDFSFSFKPNLISQPRRPLTTPRPASLLQRGRSFTGQDLANIPLTIEEGSGTEDESATPPEQRGRVRSASSPVSSFDTSPPSSISSQGRSDDLEHAHSAPLISAVLEYGLNGRGAGGMVVAVGEPITPFDLSFFTHYHTSGNSDGTATPAITLTADSPDMASDTPQLLSAGRLCSQKGSPKAGSPTSPLDAMSALSITHIRNPRGGGGPRKPASGRGIPLSRSLSEGMLPHSPNAIPPLDSPAVPLPGVSRKTRHALARPTVKRQKNNSPNLSVLVPQARIRRTSHELKSPFEPSPVASESDGKV